MYVCMYECMYVCMHVCAHASGATRSHPDSLRAAGIFLWRLQRSFQHPESLCMHVYYCRTYSLSTLSLSFALLQLLI